MTASFIRRFLFDDRLAGCSLMARVLYLGLHDLAFGQGFPRRLPNRPALLRAQIFPYATEPHPTEVVENCLAELIDAHLVAQDATWLVVHPLDDDTPAPSGPDARTSIPNGARAETRTPDASSTRNAHNDARAGPKRDALLGPSGVSACASVRESAAAPAGVGAGEWLSPPDPPRRSNPRKSRGRSEDQDHFSVPKEDQVSDRDVDLALGGFGGPRRTHGGWHADPTKQPFLPLDPEARAIFPVVCALVREERKAHREMTTRELLTHVKGTAVRAALPCASTRLLERAFKAVVNGYRPPHQ